MDNWYYKLFGDEFGPVTLDGLVELAKSQTLSPDDEVRYGETGPWRRAGSMGQLMTHMPSGAHLPSTSASGPCGHEPGTSLEKPKSDEPTGWYYQVFGEQFGPLSFDDLVELAKNQTLSVDDEVRFGENGAWRRAGSIGQLMAHLPFQNGKNAFSIELKQTSKMGTDDSTDELYFDEQAGPLLDQFPSQSTTESLATKRSPAAMNPSVTPIRPPAATPPEPVKEDTWWCMISGKEYGPVALSKLITWASNGRLLRKDFVRRGLDPYFVADQLPGLFPELPAAAAVVETQAEIKSVTRTMPTAMTASQLATATPEAIRPDQTPSAPRPAESWQTNAGSGGGSFNRPTVPMRRQPPKSSSNDLNKYLKPVLGVVGALLACGLIYFALPYLPLGDSADVKNFKALRAAYGEIQKIRSSENAPKKEEFVKAGEVVAKAAKLIEKEIKGKTPPAISLRSLAKKLQELSKEDLTKVGDAEKAVGKQFEKSAKLLNVK